MHAWAVQCGKAKKKRKRNTCLWNSVFINWPRSMNYIISNEFLVSEGIFCFQSGLYVTPKHLVFRPAFSTWCHAGSHSDSDQIKTKSWLWSLLLKPVGAWGCVHMSRVKLKAEHVGLQPPSYIWGETLEDGWRLARWGIPLWLSFSSSPSLSLSLRRSSPSLIGSKWAAVGQTHWLRGFPRELNLGRRPLVFLCRLKFGQTPFPLAAKTPFPIKTKQRRTHST